MYDFVVDAFSAGVYLSLLWLFPVVILLIIWSLIKLIH